MSVLASSVILPGSQILIEHPAIFTKLIEPADFTEETTPLYTQINQTLIDVLPDRTQREVLELAASVGPSHVPSSVLATNSFQVEINGVKHAALFPMVSRFNHDCRPNIMYMFSPSTLTMTLRALRRIEASEELTISYVPADRLKSAERLDFLNGWGFRCLCHQCTLPDYLVEESDNRIESIGKLRRELDAIWNFVKEGEKTGKDPVGELGLHFEEVEKKFEYYLTLSSLERVVHTLPNIYLLAARLLSRSRPLHPSESSASQIPQPPLTIAQIHIVLKYITLAIESGLNTFGKNWGTSYNELIRLERKMQEMLEVWEQVRAGAAN